jgi:hypothetical protein
MATWDFLITASKLAIISALWVVNGSLLAALLLYALLVALPLLLMRILSGYSIASLQSLLLAFVGLDLLQARPNQGGSQP